MKKRTKFRSRLSDVLIVLVCLGICGTSLWYFWKDLNSSTTRSDKDRIATIYFKHKIAQRKFNDRVVWERLSQNSPLYNEDTIRTADFAQAIIRFKDGTLLDVYENTMLQIYYTEEGVKIAVENGDIQVDSTAGKKNVSLAMEDGSVVNLDAGSRMSAKVDSGSEVRNFEVKSGSAAVKIEGGKSEVLKSGESVSVENDGGFVRNAVTVTSVSKDLKVLNVTEKPVPVKLEWKTSQIENNEPSKVIVETSRKKDFSVIEKSYATTDSNSMEVSADKGTLYWRVYTEDTKEKPVVGKVTVQSVEPVATATPAAGTEFRYRNENPKILFSWKGNDYASRYKLIVSSTPDMKNPLLEEEIIGSSFSNNSFAEGQYYWQVTPFYPMNDTGYASPSVVTSFNIVKNEQIKAPSLSMPADKAKITYLDKISASFAWKSEIKDAEYRLLVSKDTDFENIVLDKNVSSTKTVEDFKNVEIKDGDYFWKIIRSSKDPDDINPESEVRRFTLSKYVPGINRLVYPPENFEVEAQKLENTKFVWRLADEYKAGDQETVFQISKKSDFSTVEKETKIAGTTCENLKLSEGEYFWRIGIQSEEFGLTATTEPRKFSVIKELGIPDFILPLENSIAITYESKSTRFAWSNVSGADYYNLKVYDSEGKIVGEKSGVKETFASFVLPADSYRCSVQAVAEESAVSQMRYGKQQVVSFALRNASPVVLSEPMEASRIDGLNALRKPVVFNWHSGDDKASKSSFVLYKVQPSGSLKEVSQIDNPKSSISLNRLTEGSYRWTVKASTFDGVPLDAEMRSFVITPVAKLPAPVLVEPENNFVVGPVYLRKHRFIQFDWNPVPGATDYTFTLYQKKSDGSMVRVYSEKTGKSTEVKFKELSKLDIGTFEWNVTAYAYAKDGYEEQTGNLAEGKFKISFDLPEKVKTIKPGRMYGE